MAANDTQLTEEQYEQYLHRIGLTHESLSRLSPEQRLRTLAEHHSRSIPFGNVHVLQGRPILIDLPSIIQKLVCDQQGGYCFEQNILLYSVLRHWEWPVVLQGSRVVLSQDMPQPDDAFSAPHGLTHVFVLARVDADEGDEKSKVFLVDTGFGGHGPIHPVLFDPSKPTNSYGSIFSFVSQEIQTPVLQHCRTLWYLSTRPALPAESAEEKPLLLYEFDTTREVILEDVRLANYWISTHDDSIFTKNLFVSGLRQNGEQLERVSLWNLRKSCTNMHTNEKSSAPLTSPQELMEALRAISLCVDLSTCEGLFTQLQSRNEEAPINA